MKVAVNRCHGGFGLSFKAQARYWELKGRPCFFYTIDNYSGERVYKIATQKALEKNSWNCLPFDLSTVEEIIALKGDDYKQHSLYLGSEDEWRADPHLIQVLEEMGEEAWGYASEIEIVEVPDDTEWTIEEYDGSEWIAEIHQTW